MSPFRTPGQRPSEPPPVSTSEFEKTLKKKRIRMFALVFGIVALLPLTWFGPHAWEMFTEWRIQRKLAALPENQIAPLTQEEETRLARILDPVRKRHAGQAEAFRALWPQLIDSAPPDEGRKCTATVPSIPIIVDNTHGGAFPPDLDRGGASVVAKAEAPIESPHVVKLGQVLAAQAEKATRPARRRDHRWILDGVHDEVSKVDLETELVIVVDRWVNTQVTARAFLWSPRNDAIACAGWMIVRGSTAADLRGQAVLHLVVVHGELAKRDPTEASLPGSLEWAKDVTALPILPAKPPKPVVVKRAHRIGQRYDLQLVRSGDDENAVLTGTATVVEAERGHAVFALGLEPIREGGRIVVPATPFEITADFSAHPWTFGAKELGSRRAGLYLTPVEAMFGGTCEPPVEAHVPGDRWTSNTDGTDWKMTGYDTQGGRAYASFEGQWQDPSWTYVMRLAVDDGFTGSCKSTNRVAIGKRSSVTQVWTLAVKRLPMSAEDAR